MRALGFVSSLIFSASAQEYGLIGEEGFYRFTSGYMEDRDRKTIMMRGEKFFIDETGTVRKGSPFGQVNGRYQVLDFPRGFIPIKGMLVEPKILNPSKALLLVHKLCTIQFPWLHRTHFNVICGSPLKGMRIRFRLATGTKPDLSEYGFQKRDEPTVCPRGPDLKYFPGLPREHEKRLSGFILNAAARLRDNQLVVADVMSENRNGLVNHVVWPLPGGQLMFWVQEQHKNSIKAMIYGATSRGLKVAKTFGTAESFTQLFVKPEGALTKVSKDSYYLSSWDPKYIGLAAWIREMPSADKDLATNGIMQRVVKALITAVDKGYVPSHFTLMNFFIRFKPNAQVGFVAEDLRIVGLDRGVHVAGFNPNISNPNISNRDLNRLAATNIDHAVYKMVVEAYGVKDAEMARDDLSEMNEIMEKKSAGGPFVEKMSRLCELCDKLGVLANEFSSGEECCRQGQGLLRLLSSK